MAEKVIWVEKTENSAPEEIGEALIRAMEFNSNNIMELRSYCDKYEYICAVAVIADESSLDNASQYVTVLLSKNVEIGDLL